MTDRAAPSEAEALVERLGQSVEMLRERGKKERKNLMSLGFSIDVEQEAASLIERLAEERDSWRVPSDNLIESRRQNATLRAEVERLQEQVRRLELDGVLLLTREDEQRKRADLNGQVADALRGELAFAVDEAARQLVDATKATARLDLAMRVVEAATAAQPNALATIKKHGFVFATDLSKPDLNDAERWEKLAFTLYTDLCELSMLADEAALDAGTTPPTDPDCGGRCDCHDTDGVMFCSTCCREYQVQPAGTTPE